jgi:hypothetical protein
MKTLHVPQVGHAYPIGEYVPSGDELLRCERRGVWVRPDRRKTP